MKRKNHVMSYLVILFGVAFLLLLMAFFMERRNTQEQIDGLNFSVSSIGSVDDLFASNEALHDEVAGLQVEIAGLEEDKSDLEDTLQQQSDQSNKQLMAMDWLWRIQRGFSRGEYEAALAMVEQFEASGLTTSLPNQPLIPTQDPEAVSPAQQYNALLDALDYRQEP